jgi:chromate transport protein ChrA
MFLARLLAGGLDRMRLYIGLRVHRGTGYCLLGVLMNLLLSLPSIVSMGVARTVTLQLKAQPFRAGMAMAYKLPKALIVLEGLYGFWR